MTLLLWMAGTLYLIGLCLLFLYGMNSALLAFLDRARGGGTLPLQRLRTLSGA